jgi:hypothetical protein
MNTRRCGSQVMFCFQETQKINLRIQKQSVDHVLSQLIPVRSFTSYFYKAHFNIILVCTPRSNNLSRFFLFFCFPHECSCIFRHLNNKTKRMVTYGLDADILRKLPATERTLIICEQDQFTCFLTSNRVKERMNTHVGAETDSLLAGVPR